MKAVLGIFKKEFIRVSNTLSVLAQLTQDEEQSQPRQQFHSLPNLRYFMAQINGFYTTLNSKIISTAFHSVYPFTT